MNWSEFTKNALRTESQEHLPNSDALVDPSYVWFVLQTQIMQSEILGILKKRMFYGHSDKYDFEKEMKQSIAELLKHVQEMSDHFNKNADFGFHYDAREPLGLDPRLLHAVVGLATESGELLERLGVISEQNGEVTATDKINLTEEFGDVRWYEAVFCDYLKLDPDHAQELVIQKLQKRFPDKFNSEQAHTRNVEAELEAYKVIQ